MVASITLTSSMRSNLSSLKSLASQMSTTQTRLATGKKVNSAIDNANSYYQSRALTNRASDLDMLLDSMGQSIQTITSAIHGLEACGESLSQAAVIANEAYEAAIIPEKAWFEEQVGPNGAVVSTAQELKDAINSGKETVCVYGKIDYFEKTLSMKANQKLVGVGAYGISEPETNKFSQLNFDGSAVLISDDGVKLSDLSISFKNTTQGIISTKDFAMHNMDIYFENKEKGYALYLNHGILNITGINSIYGIKIGDDSCYAIFGGIVNLDGRLDIESSTWGMSDVTVNTYNNSEINIKSPWKAMTRCDVSLYGNSKMLLNSKYGFQYGQLNLYDCAEFTNNLQFESGYSNDQQINLNSSDTKINITSDYFSSLSNLPATQVINAVKGATIKHQDKIYRAENDIVDYHTDAGKFKVPNVFSLVSEGNEWAVDDLAWLSEKNSGREWDDNYKAVELVDSKEQYATAIRAYDEMISDSGYQGVNLLKGGKLTTTFNEDRTHSYTVEGADMSASGLGITARKWQTKGDIAQSIKEIQNAMMTIRDEVARLGNHLSIIETRMDFTGAMCDVLETGADDLVLADMNEESANYLALQTRNNLAVNALALASQSNNAVLQLF